MRLKTLINKIVSFIYKVILFKVMFIKEPLIRKIFGEVEVNTILKKMEGKKLKQTEKNYLYRSIRPKLIAAEMLSQAKILKEINKTKYKDTYTIDYNLANYKYRMILPKKKKRAKSKILKAKNGKIWDESEGGFFFTAHDSEKLIAKSKELYDGALPSGNSVAVLSLLRLKRPYCSNFPLY